MSLTIIFEKKNNEHTVYIRIANLPKRLNIIIIMYYNNITKRNISLWIRDTDRPTKYNSTGIKIIIILAIIVLRSIDILHKLRIWSYTTKNKKIIYTVFIKYCPAYGRTIIF